MNLTLRWVCVGAIGLMGLIAVLGSVSAQGNDPDALDTSAYTGSTAQAVVTSANAEDLSYGVYENGLSGTAIGTLFSAARGSRITRRLPPVIEAATILARLAHRMAPQQASAATADKAIIKNKDTIRGNCGGSASYDVDIDDLFGNFSGDMVFSDYCDNGVTVTGHSDIDGNYSVFDDDINVDFVFSGLQVRSGADVSLLSGVMDTRVDGSDTSVLMDLLNTKANGQVHWFQNTMLDIVERSNANEFRIAGRYFHPVHGYVDVVTDQPFLINSGQSHPASGILTSAGQLGVAGGATLARLQVLSAQAYQVLADATGNGGFDWQSGEQGWN